MANLFDMENPVWRFLGKIADMFYLTMLWLICSIPVVTIGASTTALFYATMRLASNKEGYLREDFFQSLKENWKKATICWLGLAVLGIFLGGDLYFYYHLDGTVGILFFWIFVLLTVIYVMIAQYIFPLLAWTDADIRNIVGLAFMMSLKNFGWTLFLITSAVLLITAALFVFWPLLFLSAGGIAYVHSKILTFVFSQYKWKKELTEE